MPNSDRHIFLEQEPSPGIKTDAMNRTLYIPPSLKSAGRELRLGIAKDLGEMSFDEFIRLWATVAYLFPNLHPDGYEDLESGWPKVLRRIADEAFRRLEDDALSEEEFYQSDAQWCGIYDRMKVRSPDEIQRRLELAAFSI